MREDGHVAWIDADALATVVAMLARRFGATVAASYDFGPDAEAPATLARLAVRIHVADRIALPRVLDVSRAGEGGERADNGDERDAHAQLF